MDFVLPEENILVGLPAVITKAVLLILDMAVT